jgi:hypothetical protein
MKRQHAQLMPCQCLLRWVTEAQDRSQQDDLPVSQRPVLCPQCKTPYVVRQRPSPFLDLLERGEALCNRMSVRGLVVTCGIGLAAASGAYGVLATRLFVGPVIARRLFSRPWWPYTYYVSDLA